MGGDWKSATVGDVFILENGFAFKSKDFLDKGVPVIKIKNVKAGYFSEHNFSYVDPQFLNSRKDKVARSDDLLISMSGNRHDGSPETWVGKVALFRKENPHLINQRVGALRVKDPNKFDPRFMSYLLASWTYQAMFISVATSSGGQANLSPTQILSAPIDFPDIETQKNIAHILGTIDDKIELNRQMNATLESMAQALFKSWFVDFDPVIDNALAAGNPIPEPLYARAESRKALGDKRKPLPEAIQKQFPSRFAFIEEMGWIPEGWAEGKLEDMVVLQRGFDLPKVKRTDGEYPLMVASGQDGTHNEYKVKGPGITTGRSGKLGEVNFVYRDFWPLNTTLWIKEYKNSSPYHALYLLRSLGLEAYNSGSAVPTLNRNHVHSLALLVPPKSVVESHLKRVEGFYEKIQFNSEQVAQVARLRDSLLPKLLSGQLRIPAAEKIVQEAI